MNDAKESHVDLTVKLNASQNDGNNGTTVVDAQAVGALMQSIPALLHEFHNKTDANEQLLVKARPFAKGSFEIPLEIMIVGVGSLLLLDPQYVSGTIQTIIDRIKLFIEIKQKLKGKPLEIKGENVIVIDNSQITLDSLVLNAINNDNRAEEQFRTAIADVRQDPTITSIDFQMGKKKDTIASIQAEEFDYFTTKARFIEKTIQEGIRISSKRTKLIVKKPDLTGASKWGVIFNERSISVGILDEKFLTQVTESEQRFGAGDELDVELEIREVFNEELQRFQEKEFFIKTVHAHYIYKPTNRKMLFDLEGDGEFISDT